MPSSLPPNEWRLPQQRTNAKGKQLKPLTVVPGAACSSDIGVTNGSYSRPEREALLRTLYRGSDPFDAVDAGKKDHRYPHSNLRSSFVTALLATITPPRLWVELGSFVGNSAITTVAVAAHHCLTNMTLLAIDPFAGDTAMWAFQRLKHGASNPPFGYDFLQLTADGRPTIRDRFLANVLTAGAAPWVVPLTVPAASGLRLLNEMSIGWRGLRNTKPDVIYLDSAHEVEETLIELRLAYSVLTPYGILFGDDWAWDGVRHDVVTFARELRPPPRRAVELHESFLRASVSVGLNCTTPAGGKHRPLPASTTLTLCQPGGTWMLFKGE